MTSPLISSASEQADIARRPLDDVQLNVARQAVATAFGPPEGRPFGVRYWSGDQ